MTQRRWFVTGTDTGVGKTLVSSAMLSLLAASGLRAVGMKPVAAGLERVDGAWQNEDVEQLHAAGNVDAPLALRCPYLLRAPMRWWSKAWAVSACRSATTSTAPTSRWRSICR